jgi:hypothetical protein
VQFSAKSVFNNKRLAVKFQKMNGDRISGKEGGSVKEISPEADHLITAVGEQIDLSWIPRI